MKAKFISRFPTSAAEPTPNLDRSLTSYFAANQSGGRSLLFSLTNEIEKLELVIMQQ
jgi:hypothetical protein